MNKLFNKTFGLKHHNEYCSGIFSDELDKLGFKNQVIDGFKLNAKSSRIFGRLRTLEIEEIKTNDENIKLGLGFLSQLKEGEVLFVKGSNEFAYFGELMSRLSEEVGIEGVVINGKTRDTFYTQNIELPIFCKGYTSRDIKGRGRVKNVDSTLKIENIDVKSGDYIFGDNDSIVIIPFEIIDKLVKVVQEAVLEEAEIKEKLAKGISISEILKSHKSF